MRRIRKRVDWGLNSGFTRICLQDLQRFDRFVRSMTGSGRRSSTKRASGDWNARCSIEAWPSQPQSSEAIRWITVSSALADGIFRPSLVVRASLITGGLDLGFLLPPYSPPSREDEV